ncbi:L-galactonate transporter [bacterium YEK0313]|nr:L-galactonate transporter [bacterium YEK0313]
MNEATTAAAPARAGADPDTRLVVLLMFGVLLLSYVINAMDRQIFPLLAADVRRDYGFSLADTGLLSTIFTLGMAVAGWPTGYLLARYSRKAVLQIGIAIFSVGTVLTAYAAGMADMLVYRAATGIGEAMQLTALIAVATSYFVRYRAVAVGAINASFGVGAILGPIAAAMLLQLEGTWRGPIIGFGLIGFVAMAAIWLCVSPALTEVVDRRDGRAAMGGAASLANRNTVLLTVLSVIGGLIIYGYLGMYPTFLREELKFSPADTGRVMSIYGLGVLASLVGGWLGDRFSPRLVLGAAFLAAAALGYFIFQGATAFVAQAALSFVWGFVISGTIYVNLAGYHVKAVVPSEAGRATGIFVTSLYGAGAFAGYLIGFIAGKAGWVSAGLVQISCLALVGALLSLALRPQAMAGARR